MIADQSTPLHHCSPGMPAVAVSEQRLGFAITWQEFILDAIINPIWTCHIDLINSMSGTNFSGGTMSRELNMNVLCGNISASRLVFSVNKSWKMTLLAHAP